MDRMKRHEEFVKNEQNKNIWITIKRNKCIGDYVKEFVKEDKGEYVLKEALALRKLLKGFGFDDIYLDITSMFFWAGVVAALMNPDDFILTVRDETGKPITIRK